MVGVLYAPKSGKETRDDLVAASLDAKEKATVLYGQGMDAAGAVCREGPGERRGHTVCRSGQGRAANQYAGQVKDAAGQYVDKGKEYYDKGRTQWSEYVDKGKDLIQNQKDAVSSAVDAGKDAYVQKTS